MTIIKETVSVRYIHKDVLTNKWYFMDEVGDRSPDDYDKQQDAIDALNAYLKSLTNVYAANHVVETLKIASKWGLEAEVMHSAMTHVMTTHDIDKACQLALDEWDL